VLLLRRLSALATTVLLLPVWLAASFGLLYLFAGSAA
jgi:hypothetical protein